MKNIGTLIILLLLIITGCNLNPKKKKSFLESIKNKLDHSEISQDHYYRLKVFHKYMRDQNRLSQLDTLSLLAIQNNYGHFINKRGHREKHTMTHADLKIAVTKEIENDSIFYKIKYENRTNKEVTDMIISINIYDMIGQYQQTSRWRCQGVNCLDGYIAKIPSSDLDGGMQIKPEDKSIYGFEVGDELEMSIFKIGGVKVDYKDNSKTEFGN